MKKLSHQQAGNLGEMLALAKLNSLGFLAYGGAPPIERTDGLVGDRQAPELSTLGWCTVSVPNPDAVRDFLAPFERRTVERGDPGFRLNLLRPNGTTGRTVLWTTDA